MAGRIIPLRVREAVKPWTPALGLGAVFLVFALLGPEAFHGPYNLKTILTQTVIVGVGALGMTLIIVGGGIDLSAGAVIALCTVLMARVLNLDAGPAAAVATALLDRKSVV